ncbi:MAG: metal ABC transporter ATP-binding protein [Planctomycetota bacterium]|nr:MAG: metal ABC transporter ATP-binding protein [Planctomycetota bacterium]
MPTPDPTTPALECDRLSYTYPGADAPALEGVTLRVERGERLGVLGPNGGGKSTFLKIAMGLIRGWSGEVRVLGEPPTAARRRRRIAAVHQTPGLVRRFPISAVQAVALAVRSGLTRHDRRRIAADALEIVGARALAGRPVGDLSGGELQRVLIARALAAEPEILALDEPMVGVDLEGQARFAALMDRLRGRRDLTVLLISHDVRAVAAGCDRVACLARTLHYHDAPEGLTPQVLAEVFRHEMAGAFGAVHVEAHRAGDCPGGHAHADPSSH